MFMINIVAHMEWTNFSLLGAFIAEIKLRQDIIYVRNQIIDYYDQTNNWKLIIC